MLQNTMHLALTTALHRLQPDPTIPIGLSHSLVIKCHLTDITDPKIKIHWDMIEILDDKNSDVPM